MTECNHLKVSEMKGQGMISIEHFSDEGVLLSEVQMTVEEAWAYTRYVNEVADAAAGV